MTTAGRLPAPERRRSLVETAARLFSERSFRGVTTADIAREAGVSEPILYRHFASKRALYLACVDAAWADLRRSWRTDVERSSDLRDAVAAMARSAAKRTRSKAFLASLWIQALTEAGDDGAIRLYLRRHVREVHSFVAGEIRRCQEAEAIPPDRDADAEAWMFLACGLLATFAERLGGVLGPDDVRTIQRERRRWLTPDAVHPGVSRVGPAAAPGPL